MKRVAIAQSNYIPWKGYFDLINFADELILYDVMFSIPRTIGEIETRLRLKMV
jgi:hypothetical protein